MEGETLVLSSSSIINLKGVIEFILRQNPAKQSCDNLSNSFKDAFKIYL